MIIKAYYTVETDEVARAVAAHHVAQLLREFPHLLRPEAVMNFQSTLPNDIRLVGVSQLSCLPSIDLVFAGWECQGHSSAGAGVGLTDPRSALFYELVRVINTLQVMKMTKF